MPTYLPNAEPFFFKGTRTGCLLIHGFTGTPYEMRGLGTWLSTNFGYTVFGPALAGHATHHAHMARTTWEDWYASVNEAYRELASQCDQVFAIGLSLGGSLVFHLAAHEPLDGVISIAAPIQANPPQAKWFRVFPFLFHLVPYIRKNSSNDDTWDSSVREKHPSYDRVSTRAAHSLIVGLLPHLRGDLGQIRAPALLIHARADRTVPLESMPFIFERLGSTDKKMIELERGGHLVLEDFAKDAAFRAIADFIREHIPAQATQRTSASPVPQLASPL